jgi:magnesium transporter
MEEMPPLPAARVNKRHKSLSSIPESRALDSSSLLSPPPHPPNDNTHNIHNNENENENENQPNNETQGENSKVEKKPSSSRSILTAEHEIPHPVVTIRERLGGYLHPRDMRRLVTPFSASNEPELMVRRHVMLLNFDPLRAIVLRDRLLILVPDGADSILISLEKRVRGGIDEMEKQVFGDGTSSHLSEVYNPETKEVELVPTSVIDGMELVDQSENDIENSTNVGKGREDKLDSDLSMEDESTTACDDGDIKKADGVTALKDDDDSTSTVYSGDNMDNEWDEFEGKDWIEMTFELQSVDAVLSSVVKMLSEESLHLRKEIFSVMEELRGDSMSSIPGDHIQEQLRVLKDKVREMEGRVQGFVRAMNQILDEEEDMALMNLSRLVTHPERFIQPVPQQVLNEESDEPELILEVYLQQALSEMNALVLLKGNILNTEELVSLQMDTIRNRLLYINTVVSAMSLCVACGSFIGSIFGMNLINYMEQSPTAFGAVVGGTVVGMVLLLVGILILISRAGVMPANPRKALYSKRRVNFHVQQI